MGAREKLNMAFFCGSLLLAALIGAIANSGFIFLLALAVLIGVCIYADDIRFKPPHR